MSDVAIHIIQQPISISIIEQPFHIRIEQQEDVKIIELGNLFANGGGLTTAQVQAIVAGALNAYKAIVDSNNNGIIDSAEKLLTRSPDNQLWEVVVDNDGSMFTNRIT